jgi:hypothetical protein
VRGNDYPLGAQRMPSLFPMALRSRHAR